MIIIAGRILVEPIQLEAFAADTRVATAGAEDEDGCLFFSFSVENPAAGVTVFLERWRDEAALGVHRAKPANRQWAAEWGSKIKIEMSKFDVENERPAL